MAYGNKYYAGYSSKSVSGTVYIDKLDYVGAAEPLQLLADGVSIGYVFSDWESPIIGLQASLRIVNARTNFFDLLVLLYSEEREYKVRIVTNELTPKTIFEGFINCETASQKYLRKQTINITASGYLHKLTDVFPVELETLAPITFIDLINPILNGSGGHFNIRVSSKLHAEGDVLSAGQTYLNKTGVFTGLFWENEVDRKSSFDILSTILKSFTSYIYWFEGYWYIERYQDIWDTSVDFVEYVYNNNYSPSAAGTTGSFTKVIKDIHSDLQFQEQSQLISVQPGCKIVRLDLNDKRFDNLVRDTLKDFTSWSTSYKPEPASRLWLASVVELAAGFSWDSGGASHGIIKNGIRRQWDTDGPELNEGLFTIFKVSINEETTKLNIAFTYTLGGVFLVNQIPFIPEGDFTFRYYLRVLPGNDYIMGADDSWGIITDATTTPPLNICTVPYTKFDKANKSVEVSINVPLGLTRNIVEDADLGPLRGDFYIVLCLATETFQREVDPAPVTPRVAWYGDIKVTTTGELPSNVIEGTANTKYIEKKSIDLDVYDAETYNYKNAILRGPTLEIRTESWGEVGGAAHIIAKGVCWNTTGTPTIYDSKTIDGSGFDEFESRLVGLAQNTLYYVRAYEITEDNVIVYGAQETFTTPYIAIGEYYRGGVIAYILQDGDEGYDINQVHGIIVSVTNLTSELGEFYGRLSGGGPYTSDAIETIIGSGIRNTNKVNANTFQNQYAVYRCVNYSYQGYDDWYWPSVNELMKIRDNQDLITASKIAAKFTPTFYWSSSEVDGKWKQARTVNFVSWGTGYDIWAKNNKFQVRAIRYF